MYQWDGFQHCITKYVMRWKTKYPSKEKKLEDLKKAAHMLQKYIENYEAFLPMENRAEVSEPERYTFFPPGIMLAEHENSYSRYISSNQFRHEGGWGDGVNLYTCLACGGKVKATGLEQAEQVHPCPAQAKAALGAPARPGGAATAAPAPAGGPPVPAAAPSAPQESTSAEIYPAAVAGRMRLNPRETD
jgi:hypothetical protein